MNSKRAGFFMKQPSGYVAFIPNPLPQLMIDLDGKSQMETSLFPYTSMML